MFGFDPDMLEDLAALKHQITMFMAATTATLQRIEARLKVIEDAQNEEREHG